MSLPALRQQLNLVIDPVVFDYEFALKYGVPLSEPIKKKHDVLFPQNNLRDIN